MTASRPGEPETRYSGCRPLVVEDDPDFRLVLVRAFAKAGVPRERLQVLSDGGQALEALGKMSPDALLRESLPPSLIVLDVNVPGKSGLELLAWIRSCPVLAEIPVFMLSATEHPDHVHRAFELGCDSYYVKPRRLDELQAVVEGMLGFWFSRTQRRLPRSGVADRAS